MSVPQKPCGVSSYDWETGTYTYDPTQMDPAQIWRSAVACAATKARQALPECSTRIDKAIGLVLNNAVELLDDGTARVSSQHNGTTAYYVVNGTCECPDFPKAPQQQCKHRLARGLAIRATKIAKELGQAASPVTLGPEDLAGDLDAEPVPLSERGCPAPVIPPQFLVTIQGKQFVLFSGLLAMAHQQGLLSLSARFISVTADLALAEATAMFHDGRTFTEAADSTPGNVNSRIKPHFARMALTRAKARALRDALNLAYVCAEELD
jgi:hypothetical protein